MTSAELQRLRIAACEPHLVVGERRFVSVEVPDLLAALALIEDVRARLDT